MNDEVAKHWSLYFLFFPWQKGIEQKKSPLLMACLLELFVFSQQFKAIYIFIHQLKYLLTTYYAHGSALFACQYGIAERLL